MTILTVCDDDDCRLVLRAAFHLIELELAEVDSIDEAATRVARDRPDLIVVDEALAGARSFCRRLKAGRETERTPLLLLTGEDGGEEADEWLQKPFSPLELLGAAGRLAPSVYEVPPGPAELALEEQLLLSNYDLRRLAEAERSEQLRCRAEVVEALIQVLAWRDAETGAHSRRVQRYARELTRELAPALLEDPSVLAGFLLHDVGKIAIPEGVLQKPGPLSGPERTLMQTHTVLGAQLLAGVSALEGAGLDVIRSHHERWDGRGYPDGLAGESIPLAARIFAVADALDARTSDRPYHAGGTWEGGLAAIAADSGTHFDPSVVAALNRIESRLWRCIRRSRVGSKSEFGGLTRPSDFRPSDQ